LCTNEDAPLVVEMLVKQGANVNATDSTGLTPADMARLQLAEAQKNRNHPAWQAIAEDVLALLQGGKAVHVARVRKQEQESLHTEAAAAGRSSSAATTAIPTTASQPTTAGSG